MPKTSIYIYALFLYIPHQASHGVVSTSEFDATLQNISEKINRVIACPLDGFLLSCIGIQWGMTKNTRAVEEELTAQARDEPPYTMATDNFKIFRESSLPLNSETDMKEYQKALFNAYPNRNAISSNDVRFLFFRNELVEFLTVLLVDTDYVTENYTRGQLVKLYQVICAFNNTIPFNGNKIAVSKKMVIPTNIISAYCDLKGDEILPNIKNAGTNEATTKKTCKEVIGERKGKCEPAVGSRSPYILRPR